MRYLSIVSKILEDINEQAEKILPYLVRFKNNSKNLIQVVFAGNPDLARKPTEDASVPIAQDVLAYIYKRLLAIGANRSHVFSDEAILAINDHSRGIPSHINRLCRQVIFIAGIEKKKTITREMVEEAAEHAFLIGSAGPDETSVSSINPGVGSLGIATSGCVEGNAPSHSHKPGCGIDGGMEPNSIGQQPDVSPRASRTIRSGPDRNIRYFTVKRISTTVIVFLLAAGLIAYLSDGQSVLRESYASLQFSSTPDMDVSPGTSKDTQTSWPQPAQHSKSIGGLIGDTDNQANTALIKAIENESDSTVVELIQRSSDVNEGNKFGNTALMAAAWSGRTKIVGNLLEHKANANLQNRYGRTALMNAASRGYSEIVEDLLAAGSDPNVNDKSGDTALMLAAENGNLAVVEALLNRSADVNAQNQSGWTALTFSAWGGHDKVVLKLLSSGADPTVKIGEDEAASAIAARQGYWTIATLLKNVADKYPQDKQ